MIRLVVGMLILSLPILRFLYCSKFDFSFNSFQSLRLIKDKFTGKAKGFAYLTFEDVAGAESAVQALSGIEMEGRALKVNVVVPREERTTGGERPIRSYQQENSVFIGNLDFDTTTDDINAAVSSLFGESVDIKVRLAVDRETGKFFSSHSCYDISL